MTAPVSRHKPLASDPDTQQRNASHPHVSAWVKASAGSGKTKVLTQRVMRLLLQGVRPERILCLTFTRAAAAEMAIRITRQLSAWATCDDNALGASIAAMQGEPATPRQMTEARRLFARALSAPGGLRIRTLHAFGQEILRRFPVESGLPPHFTVIEGSEAAALQEDCLTDLLADLTTAPHHPLREDLNRLVKTLGEQGFTNALRQILHERGRLQDAVTRAGGMGPLVTRIRSFLDLAPEDTDASLIAAAATPTLLPVSDIRVAATALLKEAATYSARGAKILEMLNLSSDERAACFDDYERAFLTIKGTPYVYKSFEKKHPDLDAVLRREATRILSLRERLETLRIAEQTAAVLRIGDALIGHYQRRKRAQAALDYDDLVVETLALLHRPAIAPWILYKLDGGLDHILVDEAQDTSRAQWTIVKILADEFFAGSGAREGADRTLFVVGDEKQSIFSFQNAEVEAFDSMRLFFERRITDADKPYIEVPLHVSFRSAPAILRAVDAVFAADSARAGVSPDPIVHESFGRDKIGRVEVWPLIARPDTANTGEVWALPIGYEDERDPQAELAQHIAATIAGWLRRGESLPDSDRPIRPDDIMILLRRRGRFAELMVRALKHNNVPVTGVDRMRLIAQLPVMDLVAILHFALLPEDDLTLATVLRGPLLNRDEDDLMRLAIGRTDCLWQRVKDHDPEAAAYLSNLLNKADFTTPFAMLAHILNEPCPGSRISGRHAIWERLGSDALDPVEELLNAAQTFSHHHAPSLQHFLHWLTASDSEIKRELDHGGGQVRMMTVHASKGLEAPIVFLPDTSGVPRVQAVPKFLWAEGDMLPLYIGRKPESGAPRHVWDAARAKQLAEYRRLLYVALTRAGRRLYIGGWETRGENDHDESWYNLIHKGLLGLHEPASVIDAPDRPEPLVAFADPAPDRPLADTLRNAETHLSKDGNPAPLPTWASRPVEMEAEASPPLQPSRLGDTLPRATPDIAFTRGRIIHRLLQSLPDLPDDQRENAAARFLANPQHALTEAERHNLMLEVMNIIHHADLKHFFSAESRAEVPIIGRVNGQKIAGQIDRLCYVGDEVWILDYKTNRPPPIDAASIPAPYRAQLGAYRALLKLLHPTATIRCFLLWTYGPRMVELLPEHMNEVVYTTSI